MKFLPIIRNPSQMAAAIFNEGPMGLDKDPSRCRL
jgi:hypothetical protein